MKLLIINGPNLNMLGVRDATHYGTFTLEQLNGMVSAYCAKKGIETDFFFSNSEGDIITIMQQTNANGIILNAGALSHYSYAIRDCIECISCPVVEVHLSNIIEREDFRKNRVFDGVVKAWFSGEKELSYFDAVDYLTNTLND